MSDDLRRARLLRAAVGLTGPVEPSSSDWNAWSAIATENRVIPLLHRVVCDGSADLTEVEITRSLEMQLDVAALCVRLELALLAVASSLDELGIDYAVLKGCATAHLDYHEPSERQFGDVDLLVAPTSLPAAVEALTAGGWGQPYSLPRSHDQFAHAITLRRRGIIEIDLHQRIAHRAIGLLVPTAELLAASVSYTIAGRRLRALGQDDRLIHASVHAVTSRGPYRRLSSVADVLLLSHHTLQGSHGGPGAVLDRAERWGVRPLVELAVEDAHDLAKLGIPDQWAEAMNAPVKKRVWLLAHAYRSDRRRPVVEELAYLQVMPTWRDRVAYLYGHLYIERGPGSGGLWKRVRYLWSRLVRPS